MAADRAKLLALLLMAACTEDARDRIVPVAPSMTDVAACTAEPAQDDDAASCAVLCAVPGGVDECPVGTPCASRQLPDVSAQQLDESLCSRERQATRACTVQR